MRIGIVAPEFPPAVGGVETYSCEFSKELNRRGHQVTVFTGKCDEGCGISDGMTIVRQLKQRQAADWELLGSYQMDAWHVMNASYAWLALKQASVIISVHGNDFISPYYLPMAPAWGTIPVLWRFESHLGWFKAELWRKSSRLQMYKGLAAARQVITNSIYTKRLLLRIEPGCATNTSVGYVGVSAEFFTVSRKTKGNDGRIRLVTMARLGERRKNVDKVLRALAQLKTYDFEFTIIGDGELRASLQKLSDELGVSDRVLFTGVVDKKVMLNVLATSDLFVLTSEALPNSIEGFGIAYLEANACGVPVLAARTAGAAEAVEDGCTGYFVETPTVSAIAHALERFFKGEITFNGERCKAFATRFSWARVVDHAFQYYPDRSKQTDAHNMVS
jgi:glycosyltransferase involved in cell wall biosynthesis